MLLSYKTILINKKQLVNKTYLLTFKLINPPEISFIPGQYLILKVNNAPRLYSIASSNKQKNQLDFIVEIIPGGLASEYFLNLKINDQVDFQGPIGQFVLKKNNKTKIFLVTGTGLAPVLSILDSNELSNSDYKIFWGIRYFRDLFFFERLKKFNVKFCLSREENMKTIPEQDRSYFCLGHVDACFEKIVLTDNNKSLENYEFYLCGGKQAVESLKNNLLAKKVNPENIIIEKF